MAYAAYKRRVEPEDQTIQATFKRVSKWINGSRSSLPEVVDGINWSVRVSRSKCVDTMITSFYLNAEKKRDFDWYCPVYLQFALFSYKSDDLHLIKSKRAVFNPADDSHFIMSLKDEELFDAAKGYVDKDEITVNILFRPFIRRPKETTEMKLRVNVNKISNLIQQDAFSAPIEFDGITWKIGLRRRSEDDAAVDILLFAEKNDFPGWICPVLAKFRLITHEKKDPKTITKKKINAILYAQEPSASVGFLQFHEFFDKANACVKDDSVIIEVDLRTVPIY